MLICRWRAWREWRRLGECRGEKMGFRQGSERVLKGIAFGIEYEGVSIIIPTSIWQCCVNRLCKSIVDISQSMGMSTVQLVRDCFEQLLRSFYRISG